MRALLQRVLSASVTIDGETAGSIEQGLLVLLGVGEGDTEKEIDYLLRKILNMRIFSDEAGRMNLSVKDIQGSLLVISQFTLYASVKKGNRPAFTEAAAPAEAEALYNRFCEKAAGEFGTGRIQTGRFAADMKVSLINDGPVTIWVDSDV